MRRPVSVPAAKLDAPAVTVGSDAAYGVVIGQASPGSGGGGRAATYRIAKPPPDPTPGARRRQRAIAVLLTNAIRRESGDHDGTLIVPCPPYT